MQNSYFEIFWLFILEFTKCYLYLTIWQLFLLPLITVTYKGRDQPFQLTHLQLYQKWLLALGEFLYLCHMAQTGNEHQWLRSIARVNFLASSGGFLACQYVWFVQIIGGCNNLLETSFLSDFISLTSMAAKVQQEDGKIQQY